MKIKKLWIRLFLLIASIVIQHGADAASNQFLGGTMWWKPVNPTDPTRINIFTKFGWSVTAPCTIGQPVGDPGTVTVVNGGGVVVGSTQGTCTEFGSADFPYSTSSNVINAAQPGGSILGIYSHDGGPWRTDIPNSGNGNWKFQLVAQTPARPDTRTVNNSPVGAFLPNFILSRNCGLNNGQPWSLPVFDPDQDTVNCRLSTPDECGSICGAINTTRANGFTNLALSGPTGCALVAVPRVAGVYGFGLQLDDYADFSPGQPLSSVPLQFLITVREDGVTNCATKPTFVRPTVPNMACLGAQPNTTFTQRVHMNAGVTPGTTITNVLPSIPSGMTVSNIGFDPTTSNYYADLTWPVPQNAVGINFACLTAVNSARLTSDPTCIDICVGAPIPQVTAITPNFTVTPFNTNVKNLTLTFNSPILAGFGGQQFRVLQNQPGTTTFTPVYELTVRQTSSIVVNSTSMFVDLSGVPWRPGFNYKFEVDNGIVINQNCCGIYANLSAALTVLSPIFTANPEQTVATLPPERFTTTTTAATTTTTTARTTTTTARTTTTAPTTTTRLVTTTTTHPSTTTARTTTTHPLTTTTTTAHTTTTARTTMTTTAHTTTSAHTTTTFRTTTTPLTTTTFHTTTTHGLTTTTRPLTTTTTHPLTTTTTRPITTTTFPTTTVTPTTTHAITTTTLHRTTTAVATTTPITTTAPRMITTAAPTASTRSVVNSPEFITIYVPYIITIPSHPVQICNCTQPDWATILGHIFGNFSLLWRNASFNIFNNVTVNQAPINIAPAPIFINISQPVVAPAPPFFTIPAPLPPPPPPPIYIPPPPIVVFPPQPAPPPVMIPVIPIGVPPPPVLPPPPPPPLYYFPPSYQVAQPIFYLQPFITAYAYPQYQVQYCNYPNSATFGTVTLPFDAFSRGIVGDALLFNGQNQYVSVQPQTCNSCFGNVATCSNGLSMCAWYMPLAVTSADQYVFSGFGGTANQQPQLALIQTATLGLQVYVSAGQNNVYYLANSGANSLTPATWSYVCFSYLPNTGINLYMNGACLSCANPNMGLYYMNFTQQQQQFFNPSYLYSTSSNQCDFYLGRPTFNVQPNVGYGRFALDQFQVWQTALSPVAIYQLYATAQPSFLWSANTAPPLGIGHVLGSSTFTQGYNGQALQCGRSGDGLVWNQPLLGSTIMPFLRNQRQHQTTNNIPDYSSFLNEALSASFKFQLLQPTSQFQQPITSQPYQFYYDTPIFALAQPSTKGDGSSSLFSNTITPPRLALSYDPFVGFRAIYWANGTIWAINGTPSYTMNSFLASGGQQNAYALPLYVSTSANHQSLTPWWDVALRGSPVNGLQLYLNGMLAGVGQVTPITNLPFRLGRQTSTRQATAGSAFYYSLPAAGVDMSKLNMYLCSPLQSPWFYQPNQLFPMRIDNLQLWPAYLADTSINTGFIRNTYGYLSLSGGFLMLPTPSGLSQVPFTAIGSPMQVMSPYGPAVQFQGNAQIQATYSASLCYFSPQYCTDGFTICAQILTQSCASGGSIFSNIVSVSSDGLLMYLNPNGTVTAYVHYGTAVWISTSSFAIRLSTYNNVCFSWSPAGGIHLSINGQCAAITKMPQPFWGTVQPTQQQQNAILVIGTGGCSSSQNPCSQNINSLWQINGGQLYAIPRQNQQNMESLSYTLADIKLWNSKFYPSELFPPGGEEHGFNSQQRSSSKHEKKAKTDAAFATTNEEEDFFLGEYYTTEPFKGNWIDSLFQHHLRYWPVVVTAAVFLIALITCFVLLLTIRNNLISQRDIRKQLVLKALSKPRNDSAYVARHGEVIHRRQVGGLRSRVHPEPDRYLAMGVAFAARRNYENSRSDRDALM